MPKFILNKLVRDKIVEHQKAEGRAPSYRALEPAEHKKALIEKIREEAREVPTFDQVTAKVVAELADVRQAFDDLCALYGVGEDDLRAAMMQKADKNGTFAGGTFVTEAELTDDSEWLQYYREHFEEVQS